MTSSFSSKAKTWTKTTSTTTSAPKLHFHTNKPYEVLEYMMSLGEVYDIVVEDMDRQSRGLKG